MRIRARAPAKLIRDPGSPARRCRVEPRRAGSLEAALRAGHGRVERAWRRMAAERERGMLALFERPALRRVRPALPGSAAGAVLVQLAAGRLRDLPRLRPRHRHRLRPGHSRCRQDLARRRDAALADRIVSRNARTTCCVHAKSAASRSMCHGASCATHRAMGDRGRRPVDARRSGTALQRFFAWLESKAYKMHIRVLLSQYRSYTCAPPATARASSPTRCSGASAQAMTQRASTIHELALHADHATAARRCCADLRSCRRRWIRRPICCCAKSARACAILCEVGLGYLTLDRQSRTLSGGEVQRINLTTALGTSLVNTLFVLDEPSIGLHARDMRRVDRGHEAPARRRQHAAGGRARSADHARGRPHPGHGARRRRARRRDRLLRHAGAELRGPDSLTGGLAGGPQARAALPTPARSRARCRRRRCAAARRRRASTTSSASTSSIPLRRLVCLTGVSGSGKSTLVQNVLYPALLKRTASPRENPGAHRALRGAELDRCRRCMIDQTPIGRTTRSNPASYVGAFDEIRALFAQLRRRKCASYTAGTFSFNSGTGRCPACGGNGFEHIEMQFLSDVYLRCGDCNGSRYRPETLQIRMTRRRRPRATSPKCWT